jgi:hypothetical protein
MAYFLLEYDIQPQKVRSKTSLYLSFWFMNYAASGGSLDPAREVRWKLEDYKAHARLIRLCGPRAFKGT